MTTRRLATVAAAGGLVCAYLLRLWRGTSSRAAVRVQSGSKLLQYKPPAWAASLPVIPRHRIKLGNLPTPIIDLSHAPGLEEVKGLRLLVKRDDMSGVELSGNKVRKLEFLLAEAKAQGHDCVITIGGIQSNHCRATACAARLIGLDSHVILRCPDKNTPVDEFFTGNLLLDRMVGAEIWRVTKEEYAQHGSRKLLATLEQRLREQGRRPYVIPVGGSNWLGSWGYIEFMEELKQQMAAGLIDGKLDHIMFACGSGGTAAGIAIAAHAAKLGTQVTAFGVCDSPKEFYRVMREDIFPPGLPDPEQLINVIDAKGVGYALSTPEELAFMRDLAAQTGVIFDPVYTGKALFNMFHHIRRHAAQFHGKTILFVHTGGLYGLYEKTPQLANVLPRDTIRSLL